MGRKSKNIKIELNRRIDELLRIGEKKIKDDKTNPNRAECKCMGLFLSQ